MTPKEKAIELVNKFKLKHNFFTKSFIKITAKQCALIAADELIRHCSDANSWYWEEVKQEIEKL